MAEKPDTEQPIANANTTHIEAVDTNLIETGQPLDDNGQPVERKLSAGEEARARIAENYEKNVRAGELKLGTIMEDEARVAAGERPLERTEQPEPAAPVETPAETGPPAPVQAVASGAADAPKPTRKVKVYGQEIEVTEDQFDQLLGKGIAFDRKAQEAAEYQRQLQAHQQPQPAPAQPPAAQPQPVQPPSIQLDDGMLREVQRRLSYGTDEEQELALRDFATGLIDQAQRRAQQGPTPDQIVHVAKEVAKAEMKAEAQFDSNLSTIGTEYPDLFKDEGLTLLAARQVGMLRSAYQQAGIQKDDLALYREAASQIQDRYLTPQAAAAPEQPQARTVQAAPPANQGRVERKRAAPQSPPAANRTASMGQPGPTVQSPADIVKWMQKSRGQAVSA